MAYQDIGFDEFLNRTPIAPQQSGALDAAETDNYLPQVSGSKIQGGQLTSPDGRTTVDLEAGLFKVSDGVQDIVQLGKIADDEIGIIIKDRNGNILLQFTGDTNLMQSPNKAFQANFNDERLLAYNEQGVPVALFGKHTGGF
jgi:hypothetical protein